MSTDIGPGDNVVCVDAGPGFATGEPVELVEGRIYTVEMLSVLETCRLAGSQYYYKLVRFRPLRGDHDTLKDLIGELDKVTA